MIAARMIEQIDCADVEFRALPAGTELLGGQYRITSYLSSGGFGITYHAKDSLERDIVIKECFPEALCSRRNKTVRARSTTSKNEFGELVKMFVREARSLSRLDHPNIVSVHQIFEDNETAYMALDFVDGTDLSNLIEDPDKSLTPAEIVELTRTLLDAITAVHDADMLHRDISPDNILLNKHGNPILIDFGAAREEAKKKSRAISALLVVKDGYSPQEFYISGCKQGPSSDLYCLAATLYHLITGEVPPNSQSRLAALAANKPDPYVPLAQQAIEYEQAFLRAIDVTMNVFPNDRPQSAQDWLAIMDGGRSGCVNSLPELTEVIANLCAEVARDIDEDSRRKKDAACKPSQAPELETPGTPEEDRWWPLTELAAEVETPQGIDVVSEVGGALEAEAVRSVGRPGRKTTHRVSALVFAAAVWLALDTGNGDLAADVMQDLRHFIENAIAKAAPA